MTPVCLCTDPKYLISFLIEPTELILHVTVVLLASEAPECNNQRID